MKKLALTYIGEDSWNRKVFKNEEGRIFKDISCGIGEKDFCTSSNFDGEPDTPIRYIEKYKNLEIEIIGLDNKPIKEERFNYMMLDRLRCDCETHLNTWNKYSRKLSEEQRKNTIEEMKKIYNSFSDDKKPEWLTWDNILEYEKQMC